MSVVVILQPLFEEKKWKIKSRRWREKDGREGEREMGEKERGERAERSREGEGIWLLAVFNFFLIEWAESLIGKVGLPQCQLLVNNIHSANTNFEYQKHNERRRDSTWCVFSFLRLGFILVVFPNNRKIMFYLIHSKHSITYGVNCDMHLLTAAVELNLGVVQ